MSTQLILSVTFEKLSTRADKSISLHFSTQELTPDHMSKLLEHLHQYSHMLIKGTDIEDKDMQEMDAVGVDPDEFVKGKTPGQRLRSVLYLLAKQQDKEKDFELYYKQKMELLITQIKEKLDEDS